MWMERIMSLTLRIAAPAAALMHGLAGAVRNGKEKMAHNIEKAMATTLNVKKKSRTDREHWWMCRVCRRTLKEATKDEIASNPNSWSHKYLLTVCRRCERRLDKVQWHSKWHGEGVTDCSCHPYPGDSSIQSDS